MPTCISVTGTVRLNLCSLEQKNPQRYPDKSEHLTPTVLKAKLPSCLFEPQIFQEQWQGCFSRQKCILFHPRPAGLEHSDVCLIRWLGSEQIGCLTATALTEQGSWSGPILWAGKLGHPSTKLLEGGSREQSLQRIPAP